MKNLSARACYEGIPIYSPPIESWRIDLSDNTNQWGAPPVASEVLRSLDVNALSRYPQPYSTELRGLLAEYAGVPAEMIVVGCGSDDIIDCAMRAFADPGDSVAMSDPTFSMAGVFAQANGLEAVRVPLRSDFTADPERLAAAGATITYLCSPNNPTGRSMSFSEAESVVNRAKGLVIVDCAYAEFGGDDMKRLAESGRAIVTRTLSKAFGLAGLRVGYGIATPEVVAAIEKARGPYKVNLVAEAVAVAAMTGDIEWVRARARESVESRERFASSLRELGYEPLRSDANFVLLPVDDCGAVTAKLKQAGIAVRGFPALTGIGDAVRITIGPWAVMQECLDAIGARA